MLIEVNIFRLVSQRTTLSKTRFKG